MGAAIARGVRSFLGGGFGRAACGLVAPGSYIIPGPAIVPLQQPVNSNKCWATVYTMLYQSSSSARPSEVAPGGRVLGRRAVLAQSWRVRRAHA